MPAFYFIRHAKAGSRSRWEQDDRLRPLSSGGFKQADALVSILAAAGLAVVLVQFIAPVLLRQFVTDKVRATLSSPEFKAKLDKRRYPTGQVVTRAEMRDLALHPHGFHGDWNYELRPRPS